MKHLAISGGGTKIGGLYGAAETVILEKNYRPDIISGVSAGAILSVPLALAMHNEDKFKDIRDFVTSFTHDDFFSVSPVKEDGSFKLLKIAERLVLKKNSIGEQETLKKTLSKYVTQAEFAQYKSDPKYANCIAGTVDMRTGSRYFFNLKELSYENYLRVVNASGSLPVFSDGEFFENENADMAKDYRDEKVHFPLALFDGGVRDHSPAVTVLEKEGDKISQSLTIFSRTEKAQDWVQPDWDFMESSVLDVLMRNIQIQNFEISKNDEERESAVAREGVLLPKIYLPHVTSNVYDVSPANLRKLYESGVKQGRNWDYKPI